ncbi:hypothetical protein [Methylobacterium sp. GC_Met_2]|uniref:hypothetical protein n=1 Tax=Methylobacterium sp. GC_Met_2 TaxID=2937376 RepID=UPI00226B0E61|nr:hypothetical protein [Methylobacterium sp. GC_Met_2]
MFDPKSRPSADTSFLCLSRATPPPRPEASEMPSCDALYLVDTNVLSAGAPTKAVPAITLIDQMDHYSARLYLSVLTVAETKDSPAKRLQGRCIAKGGAAFRLVGSRAKIFLHKGSSRRLFGCSVYRAAIQHCVRIRARAEICRSCDRRPGSAMAGRS